MTHYKTILFKKQSNDIRRYFKGYTLEDIHLSENTSFLGSNFFMCREGSVCMSNSLASARAQIYSFCTDNLSLHIDQPALRCAAQGTGSYGHGRRKCWASCQILPEERRPPRLPTGAWNQDLYPLLAAGVAWAGPSWIQALRFSLRHTCVTTGLFLEPDGFHLTPWVSAIREDWCYRAMHCLRPKLN